MAETQREKNCHCGGVSFSGSQCRPGLDLRSDELSFGHKKALLPFREQGG